jgi:alkanesulfonate monooxygenase SsuD/methylene tetrahydromethanopterin reductase-like flavin-dependent oxidoreductase (luciferase family)
MPTLEDSMAQGAWYVGTANEVAEQIQELQRDLGLSYVTIFPHFPGMLREQAIDQMRRFAHDVVPRLHQAAPVGASA